MRRGAFDEYRSEGGHRVFRLRWTDAAAECVQGEEGRLLSPSEICRAEFIRYLISRGKLTEQRSEDPGLPAST